MRDFFVDLDALQVVADDEILEASTGNYMLRDYLHFKTKHFSIKYRSGNGHIIGIQTTYAILLSGKLSDYEDSCAIVDSSSGDVYTLEELFQSVFE